ncbi:unannotated protein [freshwater metagenome]|uniref:Unannotated protein n=1 Tax=freshwater metagenome TaxID=449393 RepID=A0A6J7P0S8_9ZZZZ
MRAVDERAHRRGWVERVTHANGPRPRRDRRGEVVGDLALHQQPRVGRAHLALIEEDRAGRELGGLVEVVGVGEDEVRALTSALEPHLLHVRFAGVAQEVLAHLGGPGEGEHVDVGVTADRLAHRLAAAGHHVEHAVGQASLGGELSEAQRRQRRLLGRLEHHAVAGGERGRELPDGHLHRVVPWDDRPDDAERHALNNREVAWRRDRNLARHLVDCLGVPAQDHRAAGNVDGVRVGDELAHVESLSNGELVEVGEDQVGEPGEGGLPLARRRARPTARLEHPAGSSHRVVDVDCVAFGDVGQRRTRDRAHGRGGQATAGVAK